MTAQIQISELQAPTEDYTRSLISIFEEAYKQLQNRPPQAWHKRLIQRNNNDQAINKNTRIFCEMPLCGCLLSVPPPKGFRRAQGEIQTKYGNLPHYYYTREERGKTIIWDMTFAQFADTVADLRGETPQFKLPGDRLNYLSEVISNTNDPGIMVQQTSLAGEPVYWLQTTLEASEAVLNITYSTNGFM